jgi:hypothetical protein
VINAITHAANLLLPHVRLSQPSALLLKSAMVKKYPC